MPKDIRDILKNDPYRKPELSENHQDKFEARLQILHRPKQQNYRLLKVAATVILLVSLGYFFIPTSTGSLTGEEPKIVNLGSISPEMKQIENYYLTAINYEMASIEPTDENKAILDKYLEKIAVLTDQYKELTLALSEKGIDEKIINGLIDNLQLRLQILLELKDTIQEMKTTKNNENETSTI